MCKSVPFYCGLTGQTRDSLLDVVDDILSADESILEETSETSDTSDKWVAASTHISVHTCVHTDIMHVYSIIIRLVCISSSHACHCCMSTLQCHVFVHFQNCASV